MADRDERVATFTNSITMWIDRYKQAMETTRAMETEIVAYRQILAGLTLDGPLVVRPVEHDIEIKPTLDGCLEIRRA